MSFHANVAGILTFVQQTLPLIWRQRPDVRLVIAGSAPPTSVRRLARDPRITVTGYVPDLRSYIGRATVAISPLPYAVGIQNKVLEAMAMGTPVVVSASAAAGLQTLDGQDLLVAETAEAFAASVLHLLTDQELWQTLSQHGQAYVAAHHDWDAIIEHLTELYTYTMQEAQYIPLVPSRLMPQDNTVKTSVY